MSARADIHLALALHPSYLNRYHDVDIAKYFRGDAGFAIPELYTFLETESCFLATRLKSNAVLERHIQYLLPRGPWGPKNGPQLRCTAKTSEK